MTTRTTYADSRTTGSGGERCCLEALWHSHHTRIFGYIFIRVHDHDVADDLVSSVYLRALVAIRNGNGAVSNETAWLFTIARSVLIDHWRSFQRMTFVDFDSLCEEPEDDFGVHEQVEKTMMGEQMQRAMTQLGESQKTSLRLLLDGFGNGEIAVAMGTTETAIRAINTRARHNLRDWLKDIA